MIGWYFNRYYQIQPEGDFMRKSIFVFLLFLLIPSLLLSQENKPFFEEKSKALLFEFSGFDNLSANQD